MTQDNALDISQLRPALTGSAMADVRGRGAASGQAEAKADLADTDADGQAPSWLASTFELLHGTDIVEDADSVPDALFDELFMTGRTADKPSTP